MISYFENNRSNAKNDSLSNVFALIKNGDFKTKIDTLRKVKVESEARYSLLKNQLPAFTPSGQFKGSHKLENLVEYNPVIVLDIDKTGEGKALEIKNAATQIEYTLAAFISPSGDGVKILIKTDSTRDTHEQMYYHVVAYYGTALGVEIDKSGKNINRLCYLSYDPELYFNENVEVFQQKVSITEVPDFGETPYSDYINAIFEDVIAFTEKHVKFFPGSRNNFIFQLANNLNRAGIDESTANSLTLSKYNDSDMAVEIPKAIKNAYSHKEEFGIFSKNYFGTVSSVSSVTTVNSKSGIGTPVIPKEVYDNLPQLLKKGTDAFELGREKDVFLTGAITVLSGCFPNVQGLYDGKVVHCNLNCFVIAPPASGKGVLNFSREMAQNIHDSIKSIQMANETIMDVLIVRNSPITLFIPADSSSAAVKRTLNKNGGIGIICETEAETLTSTFKQDWGGYTNIVLKAFQHEPISFGRAKDEDDVKLEEIKYPRLSVCLSGTPEQVYGLVKSTRDGLFSRMIFYNFRQQGRPIFKNVFKRNGILNLTEYFKPISGEVQELSNKVKKLHTITVILSEIQSVKHQPYFDKLLKKVYDLFGEESTSTVIRLGLIQFRIAMLLTLLRKMEKDELTEEIECEDIDFETSLKLVEIYLEHALSVFQSLPDTVTISQNARVFWEFLPTDFTYTEALKIGAVIMGISEKTVKNYLNELLEVEWLKQSKKNGPYFNTRLQ